MGPRQPARQSLICLQPIYTKTLATGACQSAPTSVLDWLWFACPALSLGEQEIGGNGERTCRAQESAKPWCLGLTLPLLAGVHMGCPRPRGWCRTATLPDLSHSVLAVLEQLSPMPSCPWPAMRPCLTSPSCLHKVLWAYLSP